jgi:hypothetical protein
MWGVIEEFLFHSLILAPVRSLDLTDKQTISVGCLHKNDVLMQQQTIGNCAWNALKRILFKKISNLQIKS